MADSASPAGLTVYKSRNDPFRAMLNDKKFRREVKEGSSTEPQALEERRRKLEAAFQVLEGGVLEAIDLGKQAKNAKGENKTELQEQIRTILTRNTLLSQMISAGAQLLTVDCMSVVCEDPEEVEDPDNPGKTKKIIRSTRATVADLLWEMSEHTETLLKSCPSSLQLEILINMIHRAYKAANPKAFAGNVIDDTGVEVPNDDVVAYQLNKLAEAIKQQQAQEAQAEAEARAKMKSLTKEERDKIERDAKAQYADE